MIKLIEPTKPLRTPSSSKRRESSPDPNNELSQSSSSQSPYRPKVDLNMRKNMAILALKDRVLDREKHMLDLRQADPFTPISNFQDSDGNFLPRTRSKQHVSN